MPKKSTKKIKMQTPKVQPEPETISIPSVVSLVRMGPSGAKEVIARLKKKVNKKQLKDLELVEAEVKKNFGL